MNDTELSKIRFYDPKEYEIDFDQVKTVGDVVELLKSLKMVFVGEHDGNRFLKVREQ